MKYNHFIENPNTTEGRYNNRLFDKTGEDVLHVIKYQFEGAKVFTAFESDEEDMECTIKEGLLKSKKSIGFFVEV